MSECQQHCTDSASKDRQKHKLCILREFSEQPIDNMKKKAPTKQRNKSFDAQKRTPKDVFPKKSVCSLARALKGDEWQRLASALGFMEQVGCVFDFRNFRKDNRSCSFCTGNIAFYGPCKFCTKHLQPS